VCVASKVEISACTLALATNLLLVRRAKEIPRLNRQYEEFFPYNSDDPLFEYTYRGN
jgi:hypothetical protein